MLSVATQGYEKVSTLSATPNLTEHLWYYNHLAPPPKPGTLCDPHVFTVGDTFQTVMSPFIWSIDYINTPTSLAPQSPNTFAQANDNGISYSGLPLNMAMCDVQSIRVTADLFSWTTTATAIINCTAPDVFPVSASTSFTASINPQLATSKGNKFEFRAGPDIPTWHLCNDMYASLAILQSAGVDLLTALRMEIVQGSPTTITSLTASSSIASPCNSPDDVSALNPLSPVLELLGFSNMTLAMNDAANQTFTTTALHNTTHNFMQAMLASTRVNVGNRCPANILTQPSQVDTTILQTPALTNATYTEFYPPNSVAALSLYDLLKSDNTFLNDTFQFTLPLYASSDIFLQAPYLCRLTVLKSPAPLVVSVVVAMAGLFMSGWGIFTAVAAWLATRSRPEAGFCGGHPQQAQHRDLEAGTTPLLEQEKGRPSEKRTRSDTSGSSLTVIDWKPPFLGTIQPSNGHSDSMDLSLTQLNATVASGQLSSSGSASAANVQVVESHHPHLDDTDVHVRGLPQH
ncbi:hypothetical protein FRB98_006829 [Tulasnella sp. 332]|nr:hypothetical protein FRB98_006829 [Tulasnella sp. 332]